MGTSVALLALLLTGGVTWWLNARAFRPLLEVAGTLERYRKGDRAARIPETGPPEIRRIAARFNEMAAALAAQREQLMAFLGGVVPLAFATGAGAASRQSIGTGVLGGMLAATFLAIFFVPLFFVTVRKVSERWAPVRDHGAIPRIPEERVHRQYAGVPAADGEREWEHK